MNALGIFAYLLAALVLAGVLTLLISLFRNIQNNDDFKSWRWLAFFWVMIVGLPYGFIELQTRINNDNLNDALVATLKSAKVTGELSYYKIVKKDQLTADLIVVAKEKTTLTDNESCVMKVQLVNKGKKGWKSASYSFVDSFKRGKDSFVFPPYW